MALFPNVFHDRLLLFDYIFSFLIHWAFQTFFFFFYVFYVSRFQTVTAFTQISFRSNLNPIDHARRFDAYTEPILNTLLRECITTLLFSNQILKYRVGYDDERHSVKRYFFDPWHLHRGNARPPKSLLLYLLLMACERKSSGAKRIRIYSCEVTVRPCDIRQLARKKFRLYKHNCTFVCVNTILYCVYTGNAVISIRTRVGTEKSEKQPRTRGRGLQKRSM